MTREQKPTFCRICEPLCGMIATVEDGRLVALRPDKDHPLSAGFACQKGIVFTEVVNDPDRVTTPLRRGLNGFEPVTWDEAMTDIADQLADIHRRHGSRAIGWYYGNPGAFSYSHTLSLSMFMVGFGPRLHVFTAGSQDVNNRFVASQLLYGSPLALPVPDVLRTDLLVVIGANPVVSHGSVLTVPRIKDRMHDIVKRGGRVLVIDPRKTETAAQFEWLGIIPDGDAFLLLSLLHVLFGENLVDRARLARQAEGAIWLEQLAMPFRPEVTQPRTGIAPDTVRSLARDLARTERAAVYGRVGTSTGQNGTLTTYLLDAVNLAAGAAGRDDVRARRLPAAIPDAAAHPVPPGHRGRHRTGRASPCRVGGHRRDHPPAVAPHARFDGDGGDAEGVGAFRCSAEPTATRRCRHPAGRWR
jgi:anaerobic selenocysteine-containing dehydrogenase